MCGPTKLQTPAGMHMKQGHGKKPPSVLSHIVSGICGSLFAEQVLFPLDTIKVRAQTATSGQSSRFFDVIARIFASEGLLGFYKGLAGALFKESFHSANFWLWHTLLVRRAVLRNESGASLLLRNLFCKQLNWLCTTPLEVLSTLNQTTPGSPGLWACAMTLFQKGGLGELYRGLPISCALAINPAIMMLLIHKQQDLLAWLRVRLGEEREEAKKHGPLTMFYTTAVAKIVATVLTYPFIRSKVLIQVHGGGLSDVPKVLATIIREDGCSGLFKGIVAMTWKTVLHNSLMMSLKHYLSPMKAITPPASPSPRSMSLQPMSISFRSPPSVEVLAEKLDEILDTVGAASLETVQNIEIKTQRIEEKVHIMREEVRGLSGDVHRLKQIVFDLQKSTITSVISASRASCGQSASAQGAPSCR